MCVQIKAVSKGLFYSARLVTGRENIGIFWANLDRNATRENKSKIFGRLFRPERAREGILPSEKIAPPPGGDGNREKMTDFGQKMIK